jgi:hypothetical protein
MDPNLVLDSALKLQVNILEKSQNLSYNMKLQ